MHDPQSIRHYLKFTPISPSVVKTQIKAIPLRYEFHVPPWHHNPQTLRKILKQFLRDRSAIPNPKQQTKTFIARPLPKAVETTSRQSL